VIGDDRSPDVWDFKADGERQIARLKEGVRLAGELQVKMYDLAGGGAYSEANDDLRAPIVYLYGANGSGQVFHLGMGVSGPNVRALDIVVQRTASGSGSVVLDLPGLSVTVTISVGASLVVKRVMAIRGVGVIALS